MILRQHNKLCKYFHPYTGNIKLLNKLEVQLSLYLSPNYSSIACVQPSLA